MCLSLLMGQCLPLAHFCDAALSVSAFVDITSRRLHDDASTHLVSILHLLVAYIIPCFRCRVCRRSCCAKISPALQGPIRGFSIAYIVRCGHFAFSWNVHGSLKYYTSLTSLSSSRFDTFVSGCSRLYVDIDNINHFCSRLCMAR